MWVRILTIQLYILIKEKARKNRPSQRLFGKGCFPPLRPETAASFFVLSHKDEILHIPLPHPKRPLLRAKDFRKAGKRATFRYTRSR